MRQIDISPQLRSAVSHIAIGSLAGNIRVKQSPQELVELMNREAEKIRKEEQIEDIANIPAIHDTREAYKALGKKPARYRVSSEALHRRIVKGKGIYFINNVVDITNLVSIQSGIGICLYDADQIQGDISLRVAQNGESYHGIGKYELNLENLPVFCDKAGPFGSPTSDSERTMIRPETRSILFSIVSFTEDANLRYWLEVACHLFEKHADGGAFDTNII